MNIYKQVLVIIFNLFAVSLIYGYGVSKNEILILKDAQVVYLGESIQELYNSHGQPLKTTIDSFISNSDWDSICLEYNDFNVSYFKITQKLRQIETKGNHFKIKLQKVTLYAGMDIKQVEDLIGIQNLYNLNSEHTEKVLLCELPDFVEAYLFFNHEDKLKKVVLGYQEH